MEATHLRRVTTSSTVEKLLGTYERVIGLGREGKLSERETRMLRERILTEGTLDLD